MRGPTSPRLGLLLLLLLGAGCGKDDGSTQTSGQASDTASTGTSGSASTGAPADSGSEQTGEPLCPAEIDALAPLVTEPDGGCSVIVRLEFETFEPLGFQSICSPYVDTWLDESGARALTDCCQDAGEPLDVPANEAFWLFYQPPSDFGAIAAVTNHIAQRVFEGSIIWSGVGQIDFPEEWRPPSELGADCGEAAMPTTIAYAQNEAGELPADIVEQIWGVVGTMALLPAMETLGSVQRMLIFPYFPSDGVIGPIEGELIVVLEGGV